MASPQVASTRANGAETDSTSPDSSTVPYVFQVPLVSEHDVERIFAKDLTPEEKALLNSSEYNALNFSAEQLLPYAFEMFRALNLIEEFSLSIATLQTLLVKTQRSYRTPPFHNFHHAFTVAQMVFLFLKRYELSKALGPQSTLVLLLSAIFHDIDHNGLSNTYHTTCKTPLALTYNNNCPLESHHAHCAKTLLKDTRLLDHLSEHQAILESISVCILGTDMSRHFSLVDEFKSNLDSMRDFSSQGKEQRNLLLSILLKAADISNEARPWSVSLPWADALQTEFFQQGDVEREKGLSVLPFMDRHKADQNKGQMFFLDTFLIPTLKHLSEIFNTLQPCLQQVELNRQRWEALANQSESQE